VSDRPFVVVGHGLPKVTDELYVWLLSDDAPSAGAAEAACAALPPGLAEWITPTPTNDGGALSWHGSVLHLHTGYGVKYYAKALEDEHLAWLPVHGELSDADIERVLDEVMDAARKGPRAPAEQGWRRLGAQLLAWFDAVHAVVPLSVVVVGRKVKAPGPSPHREAVRWVRAHLGALADRAAQQRRGGSSWASSGWGPWIVRAVLADVPAKKLPAPTRRQLLEILDGAGVGGDAEGSKLLAGWPSKERPRVLAELLRAGHDLGPWWLSAKATHKLLFDDEVFEAACSSPHGLFGGYVIGQALARWERPAAGIDRAAWLARWVAAMAPRGAELAQHVAAAPDDVGAARELADWTGVVALLDGPPGSPHASGAEP